MSPSLPKCCFIKISTSNGLHIKRNPFSVAPRVDMQYWPSHKWIRRPERNQLAFNDNRKIFVILYCMSRFNILRFNFSFVALPLIYLTQELPNNICIQFGHSLNYSCLTLNLHWHDFAWKFQEILHYCKYIIPEKTTENHTPTRTTLNILIQIVTQNCFSRKFLCSKLIKFKFIHWKLIHLASPPPP